MLKIGKSFELHIRHNEKIISTRNCVSISTVIRTCINCMRQFSLRQWLHRAYTDKNLNHRKNKSVIEELEMTEVAFWDLLCDKLNHLYLIFYKKKQLRRQLF